MFMHYKRTCTSIRANEAYLYNPVYVINDKLSNKKKEKR